MGSGATDSAAVLGDDMSNIEIIALSALLAGVIVGATRLLFGR